MSFSLFDWIVPVFPSLKLLPHLDCTSFLISPQLSKFATKPPPTSNIHNMSRYGCFFRDCQNPRENRYLPQVGLDVNATLLSTTARTTIIQTFLNPSKKDSIPDVCYTFPLYDEASMVSFACHVGDNVIYGKLKTRKEADDEYRKAKSKGQTVAIFDHTDSCDIFSTRVGNVPIGGEVTVEIILVHELKRDAQSNGLRYIVPVAIAPRAIRCQARPVVPETITFKIAITVDVVLEQGSVVHSIRSLSHPASVILGRTSSMAASTCEPCYAYVWLLDSAPIHEDIVLFVNTDKENQSFALLETHPTIPNQRALMVSVTPALKLPPSNQPAEIIVVIGRSQGMNTHMPTVRVALETFLEYLPLEVHFNIILCGLAHRVLWSQSRVCTRKRRRQVFHLAKTALQGHMGGADILNALRVAVKSRCQKKALEVLLLTDGLVENQAETFAFIRKSSLETGTRFFALGFGSSLSSPPIEEAARLGMGFSQSVSNHKHVRGKAIRMLKGALTPRLANTTVDFSTHKIWNGNSKSMNVQDRKTAKEEYQLTRSIVPLFEAGSKEVGDTRNPSQPLPTLSTPNLVQAPRTLPSLHPSVQSTFYCLLSKCIGPFPEIITLRATSEHGPLTLNIPVYQIAKGETIHQLAAKQTMHELEEGLGRIRTIRDCDENPISERWESATDHLVQKECK